jgi:hypothetical protein
MGRINKRNYIIKGFDGRGTVTEKILQGSCKDTGHSSLIIKISYGLLICLREIKV